MSEHEKQDGLLEEEVSEDGAVGEAPLVELPLDEVEDMYADDKFTPVVTVFPWRPHMPLPRAPIKTPDPALEARLMEDWLGFPDRRKPLRTKESKDEVKPQEAPVRRRPKDPMNREGGLCERHALERFIVLKDQPARSAVELRLLLQDLGCLVERSQRESLCQMAASHLDWCKRYYAEFECREDIGERSNVLFTSVGKQDMMDLLDKLFRRIMELPVAFIDCPELAKSKSERPSLPRMLLDAAKQNWKMAEVGVLCFHHVEKLNLRDRVTGVIQVDPEIPRVVAGDTWKLPLTSDPVDALFPVPISCRDILIIFNRSPSQKTEGTEAGHE